MGWAGKLKLHRNIAEAISTQSPVVRDALGRVLEVGDEVILSAPVHTYRVSLIEPVRQEGFPPNVMRLQLVSVVDLPCPREEPQGPIIRIQTVAEILVKQGKLPAESEAPAPPAEVVPPEVKTNRGGLVIP